jgi:tRNA nucleotidyltransferase (CCA-adding enzyme)
MCSTKPNISIPAHIRYVIEQLESAGFQAWCVGGCVRDSLLGKEPLDWDITTTALPQQTLQCFPRDKTVTVGISHGTVAVILPEGMVEVTTCRIEGTYADHRHPEHVCFTTEIEKDLARRDFTINAMAYNERDGLIDLFEGQKDLREEKLRCVGNPTERFHQDALRILRCLRFASRLGFSIEKNTADALLQNRDLLQYVSKERIREECLKLLCGENVLQVLSEYAPILFQVIPVLEKELGCTQNNPYHCFDVWHHTLHALQAAPPDPIIRMALLLHDCGKPIAKTTVDGTDHFYGHERESEAIAKEVLESLRFSNQEKEDVLFLIRTHGEPAPLPLPRIKRLLGKVGPELFFQLMEVKKADLKGQPSHLWEERMAGIFETENIAKEILSQPVCLSIKDLAVNGKDLLALGIPQGPMLGKLLSHLLNAVLQETVTNDKEALLNYLKQTVSALENKEREQ